MAKRLIPPNSIERWLNKTIFVNKYVYLDRWSFVHLASGAGLGYLIDKYFNSFQYPFLLILGLLIGYEIFEFIFWDVLFRRESFKNIWWDVKVGMIGYWIYLFWFYV